MDLSDVKLRAGFVVVAIVGCARADQSADARVPRWEAQAAIATAIRESKACNQRRDIGCFLAPYDSTFVLESNESPDSGRTITLDSLRADILRDWSIVDTMYEVEQWIDSLQLHGADTAIVYTNQFYHRTFHRPNGKPGTDDVVTTQKHRETWLRRSAGWKQSRVRELGGSVYVNGRPYNPTSP